MNIEQWLTENAAQNSETVVSLENLVISQEGFFDKAKEFIFGAMGKSLKGDDYKPVKLEHTYNFKSTITAISRQYGNSMWLNKQNWVSKPVDGSDIGQYLGNLNPKELQAVLEASSEFTIRIHREWLTALTAYFNDLKPVVEILKDGLTDDAFDRATKLLKRIPDITTYYKNPPRSFPVCDRKIATSYAMIIPPGQFKGTLAPLNFQYTERAVKTILLQLEELNRLRNEFTRVAFDVVNPIATRAFIQLSHSGTPKLPKDSKRPLKGWVELSTRLDAVHMYWRCEEFAVTRRYYGDVVLATCRWIDRSIR